MSTCPTGYAKTADECYNKGSAGWSLDLTDKYDSTDCYKCTAKSCEVGYSTDITSLADCGTTGSAGYTFTKSESGYSGDDACGKCECTDPCKDTYTGEIPENAHAVTEACKACDEEKDIVTDWACDDGYIINSAKTGCIPATCPVGYAKVASECSASGSGAWHLDMNNRYDSTDCYKCEPDACKGESSTTITINQCGSADIGSAGWSLEETGVSGEDKCYTCKKLACETGYSTETTSCNAGYELVTKDYSGDDECGKCVEKDCSAGYSKSITSEANCSAGYSFKQDPDNPLCGMCEEKSCPDGFTAGLTDPSQCGVGGEEGWFVEFNGNESCGLCTPKTCGDHGLESTRYNTVCLSEKVYIGNDLVDCYDCVGCDKFDIYNSTGSLYDVYRDSIDISCSEWCRYDKSTPDITDEAIPYLIYKKSVKDKAGRSGDCYGLIDVPGKWEIETNEKKMCCCLYGEDLTASGCIESGK